MERLGRAFGRQREARSGEARRTEKADAGIVREGEAFERPADEVRVEIAVAVGVVKRGGGIGAGRQVEMEGHRPDARRQMAVAAVGVGGKPVGSDIDRQVDLALVAADIVDDDSERSRVRRWRAERQRQPGRRAGENLRFHPSIIAPTDGRRPRCTTLGCPATIALPSETGRRIGACLGGGVVQVQR